MLCAMLDSDYFNFISLFIDLSYLLSDFSRFGLIGWVDLIFLLLLLSPHRLSSIYPLPSLTFPSALTTLFSVFMSFSLFFIQSGWVNFKPWVAGGIPSIIWKALHIPGCTQMSYLHVCNCHLQRGLPPEVIVKLHLLLRSWRLSSSLLDY